MVTDIQGFGYKLTDPEIASSEALDDKNDWNFCEGNGSMMTITKFLEEHDCNKFCKMLKLKTSTED